VFNETLYKNMTWCTVA